MSTYNERYDDALLKAQWVAKTASNGRTYLFKYAPHPERTGYLFAATDMETVHFEALTGTSVLTRLAQVVGREEGEAASDGVTQLGFDEGQARTDEALKQLSEVFDGGWADARVSAESDDYFDAVFAVAVPSFAWVFNMTEMRGRQPLAFIARHLVAPFSALMAQDRGVDIPGDSSRPVDAVAAVVSDAGVARGLRRVTGAPPPASSRATPALLKTTPTPASPARVKTPSRSPERTPVARPPTPPRASTAKAVPPILPPSSPTPAAKRQRAYDYAAGLLPSSGPASPGPTTDTVPEQTSPVTAHRTAPSTRTTPPPSTPPRNLPLPPPTSDMPSSSLAEPPTSTLDPLIPTQKKKKKKKDKKEEEEAEEAEADKRRAEMKRRMAAGAGGRLGRRRV